ncbi:small GTP-binding protein domain-containing protein [Ruminococcus sp. YRD2003]|uniref:translation factor GTPase family protein n=1 Tax=Ruminococcus sp. YRD2003 TaxID=1452313 RepID=UPI0008D4D2B8|nr:small GTP-binding protein domain-containing protein [Ruminococcus flavefaciens]
MKTITVGITAHVDSGKTTLAEAMLYTSGQMRKLGRVDDGSSSLDTDSIERERGITIFAHQAEFTAGETRVMLLDTPGHVDFSSETERTMSVLDYAVLVISGTDGVQSHTATLWKLLRQYEVPVFIFVNKMDLITADKGAILSELRRRLSSDCCDFSGEDVEISENAAACSEELMETYLSSGGLSDADISRAIAQRRLFPCFFGSALKMQGIERFIEILDRFTAEPQRLTEFGASVYKISYDAKGTRLTHLKINGGRLSVRDELTYTDSEGSAVSGKVSSVRFYSGEKFSTAECANAGEICSVTGLSGTYSGQGLGCSQNSAAAMLEPIMTYRVGLPKERSVYDILDDLRRLEDEDPQLHIVWNEQLREIHIQLMGAVQLEVLTKRIEMKYGYKVSFEDGAITYRETIRSAVEGVGHYEPLRHYAEVHLLIEPLERGRGLEFRTDCPEDDLDRNWQRLILTHLKEKAHIGVLTGSPVTDIRFTLKAGRAHLKHTEGGDFRQATYRAVRQGIRSAESILLEPYYDYELEVPSESVGRAISDLQHFGAEFDQPETEGEMSVIKGSAPVSEIGTYQLDVNGYTKGRGRLTCTFSGYRECHDSERVIADIGYDCDSDIENSADSVFCSHGAGYVVKWNEVPEHMHLPSCMAEEAPEDKPDTARIRRFAERTASDEELMAIFERTYGKLDRDPRRAFKKTKAVQPDTKNVKLPEYEGPDYLLVDGYNIIFAWDALKKIAAENLDAARSELINMMCSYQGCTGYEIIVVFDAYKVKGRHRDIEKYYNISIVYTKESETADSYIERVSHELSKKHRVMVATSDGLEQMIILGNGAMRWTAAELYERYRAAGEAMKEYMN